MPVWWDRFLASDPGLNRLRSALQAVLTIGVAMLAEWTFVQITHAMQLDTHGAVLPPAKAAAVEAQHHAVTVIGVMVGAVVGMISAFTGGMFPSKRAQVAGFLLMPPFMVAGLAIGFLAAPYRPVSLGLLVVILAAGAYCRRFGPLGFVGGQMVFMGDFFGFFLNGALGLGDIGWLAAEICIGAAVALLAQFTLFYPGRRRALARMQRSYDARRRDVVEYAVELLAETAESRGKASSARGAARLERRLVRLNEAALMIDGHLNDPASIPPGWSAETLHQILFDAELAVSNMTRFVEVVTRTEQVPDALRNAVRQTLVAVSRGDFVAAERRARELLADLRVAARTPRSDSLYVVVHRFCLAVVNYADAQRRWREAHARARLGASAERPADAEGVQDTGLDTPVVLMGGFLPGSAQISQTASTERDRAYDGRWRFWRHVPLTPNVRVAIQMAVAVAGAILIGEVLSERRFYWAVIAAFVTFMGANNATEQVRKGLNRVIGTFVGVIVGAVLAHLVGAHTDIAIAVILVAIFLGLYLMRISYIFMVMGITVMVSQLYVQLNEFSDQLLLLRLAETALGAAIASLTVVLVLPLKTQQVARVAAREFLVALGEVATGGAAVLAETGNVGELRAAMRRMDDAYQALVAITRFLRTPVFDRSGSDREQFQAAASAARHYARNLMIDAPAAAATARYLRTSLDAADRRLTASVDVLVGWFDTGARSEAYVRSASLFDRVDTEADAVFRSPLQLALRDLQRLDGALAKMAELQGLRVEALDTVVR